MTYAITAIASNPRRSMRVGFWVEAKGIKSAVDKAVNYWDGRDKIEIVGIRRTNPCDTS